MSKRISILICIWTTLLWSIPNLAWAYIDPATTTYIIQVFAAIIITLGVTLSIVVYRIQTIVTSVRMMFYRFYKRVIKREHVSTTRNQRKREKGKGAANEADETSVPQYIWPENVLKGDPIGSSAKRRLDKQKKQQTNATSTKEGYREGSWRFLVADTRKLRTRLLIAALLAAAISITVFVFTPLDILASNLAETAYLVPDMIPTVLLAAAVVFVVLTLILLLFRGRLFDIIVALGLALLIALYLQANFLNPDLGSFTGDSIQWYRLRTQIFINFALWIGLFVVVFIVKYFWRSLYTVLTLALPAILICIQVVALISLAPQLNAEPTPLNPPSGESGQPRQESGTVVEAPTDKDFNVISSDHNIIVFVLDTVDNRFIDEVQTEEPDFFNELDGFTRFTNYMTYYRFTHPSIPEILTGYKYLDGNQKEFYDIALTESDFLPDLKSAGYSIRTYTDSIYASYEQSAHLIDNMEQTEMQVDRLGAYKSLLLLSFYREAPLALKPALWTPTGNMSGHYVRVEGGNEPYIPIDDVKVMQRVRQGIHAENTGNNFVLYHLLGSHFPLYMDENAEYADPSETSVVQQTMGSFNIVFEYLEQLKELGLYENSTIIITADHGARESELGIGGTAGPWRGDPTTAALFVKPAGVSETALQTNNAPLITENLRSTIIAEAGLDHQEYGPTVFEVEEDDMTIVRRFYWLDASGDTRRYQVLEVVGDAKEARNWTLLDEEVLITGERLEYKY